MFQLCPQQANLGLKGDKRATSLIAITLWRLPRLNSYNNSSRRRRRPRPSCSNTNLSRHRFLSNSNRPNPTLSEPLFLASLPSSSRAKVTCDFSRCLSQASSSNNNNLGQAWDPNSTLPIRRAILDKAIAKCRKVYKMAPSMRAPYIPQPHRSLFTHLPP